jgi:hypothetical protein
MARLGKALRGFSAACEGICGTCRKTLARKRKRFIGERFGFARVADENLPEIGRGGVFM